MKNKIECLAVLLSVLCVSTLTGCGCSSSLKSSSVSEEGSSSAPSSVSSEAPAVYFTVKFLNWDDMVLLDNVQVKQGENAIYTGDTPTREGDAQSHYSFTGWDKSLENIQADTTFTAQFVQSVNTYTVTFKNYDGTVLDTQTVNYGGSATYSKETPKREEDLSFGYFEGWDKVAENVTADLTVTAKFFYVNLTENSDGTLNITKARDEKKTFTEFNVPSSYKGKNITTIGESAIGYISSLVTITLPETITSLGDYCFTSDSKLENLSLPSSLKSLGDFIISDDKLVKMNVKDDMNYLGNENDKYMIAVSRVTGTTATTFTIDDTTRFLAANAFEQIRPLGGVTLPKGLLSIGRQCFYYTGLNQLIIPSSVTYIGKDAFCYTTSYLYFEATEPGANWNSGWSNNHSDIFIFFYSETQKTGNYWHYVNGVVTKWNS